VLWLEDKKTDSWVNLIQSPEYIFSSSPTDSPDRFILHFSNPGTGFAVSSGEFLHIYSYETFVYVSVQRTENVSGNVYLYDVIGRLVFRDKLKNTGLNKFEPGIVQGTYIVKVVTGGHTVTQKVFLK
jgi:hypothetical protein